MIDTKELLISKSIESFLLALEIFNKPTIKYRAEGFSFFICNAWELMLKAHLLNKGISIFYKDNQNRTLALNDVLGKIYTDKNSLGTPALTLLMRIMRQHISHCFKLVY